jgi:O-antigen ligase
MSARVFSRLRQALRAFPQTFEEKLLALFLFTVPFQARVFLGDLTSDATEWTRASLWVSDLAFFLLIFAWIRRGVTFEDLTPLALLLVFLPSLVAHFSLLGGWVFLKIAEGLLLFSYARRHRNWLFTSQLWPYAFLVSCALNAFVGIAQFGFQHDLGLQLLGESPLSPTIPGVAKLETAGAKLIRAYGFTPHPNILGAILLGGVAIVMFLYLYRGVGWIAQYRPRRQREELIRDFFLFLFLFGIFLSFSRIAWFATLATIVLVVATILLEQSLRRHYLAEALRFMVLFIAIVTMIVLGFGSLARARATLKGSEDAVLLREFYGKEALAMIGEHPYLGVGPGRFVPELIARNPEMPLWQAQPVHNVILLLAAENGIPATAVFLIAFIFLVIATWRRVALLHDPSVQLANLCLLAAITAILLFSSFDHFLWTSQQGRMLLWFTLGLLAT